MAGLGKELREARESRKISLDDIAASTRIGRRYLEALESDRLDIMPGGFFIKAIIRSYAKALGLDSEFILNKYRQAGIIGSLPEDRGGRARDSALLSGKNRLVFWSGLVIVLVMAAVVVTLVLKPEHHKQAVPGKGTSAAVAEPVKLLPPSTPPENSEAGNAPAGAEQKQDGLNIEIAMTGDTWLQIYSDGTLVIDGLFLSGKTLTAKAAREFVINTGNAGGFTFRLNGKAGKPLGAPGEVKKDIRIGLDDLARFVVEEPAASQAPDRSQNQPASGLR